MDSTADRELEMIRADAHQARANLAGKLEALESQVTQTVAGVTSAVETVSNTVGGVTSAVESVAEQVTGTVASVSESVSGTVSNLTDSVSGAMKSAQETLDVPRQAVVNHPWAAVGCAIAAGAAAAMLLGGSRRTTKPSWFGPALGAPQPAQPASSGWASALTGNGHHVNGNGNARDAAGTGEPSVIEPVCETMSEIGGAVRSLGISALMGVVTHLATSAVPEQLKDDISGALDKLKTRLGGHHKVPAELFNTK